MAAYYNEIDPYAAQWLRNLIARGHIAPGDVDERSIVDVRADDLRGYTQCHFFAGIGVWSYALRRAGWPDEREVWTGSCPCQPFSAAGRAGGFCDERHLWPHWSGLIGERRPVAIFGEQVASADGLAWLDFVCADLEAADYAVGTIDLCAAGVGAPHIRQRLFFVADANASGSSARAPVEGWRYTADEFERLGAAGFVADASHADRRTGERGEKAGTRPDGKRRRGSAGGGAADLLEHAEQPGLEGHGGHVDDRHEPGRQRAHEAGSASASSTSGEDTGYRLARRTTNQPAACLPSASAGPVNGFWSDADWLPCRDGKARPVEPGTFPLAHGAPARVGRLRAYGNAINAEVAAEFIRAYLGSKS